ncbi:MAG: hypothetical protein OXH71_02015 [Candidatus Dadabacteria bacterium]|nr:hypothetical protein [Candidatus Dadabacteria bacterium]MDE0519460.1 hypothetical protein [Candidatus Dadabacteria bacterium]MDE0663717.1 hypothetical protein [Candidatus Dadabacteria bacterium]
MTTEKGEQRFTVIKTTRDKRELYLLSTYTVNDRAARSIKKKKIK